MSERRNELVVILFGARVRLSAEGRSVRLGKGNQTEEGVAACVIGRQQGDRAGPLASALGRLPVLRL